MVSGVNGPVTGRHLKAERGVKEADSFWYAAAPADKPRAPGARSVRRRHHLTVVTRRNRADAFERHGG